MKNLLALFYGLIFFASCTSKDVPDNLIDKDDMANLLIDMHLADAALDYTQNNNDTLLMYAKSKYNYIFKKHGTDSVAFSESLKYYSNNSEKFAEMYKNVLDALEKMHNPEPPKIYRTKRIIPDSLRFQKYLSAKDTLLNKKSDTLAVKKQIIKPKPLDGYLRKIDSLNTVKLLEIGIDF